MNTPLGLKLGQMKYLYNSVDLRVHSETNRIGQGELGVFHAEPYESELLLWS